MATETVANVTREALDEIYRDLCGIESLAQLLQKAFQSTHGETTGVYGTAMVIEQIAQRAQNLTGV